MKRFIYCVIGTCVFVLFSACASTPKTETRNPQDPYEAWNRKVFAFNETFDTYLLKPVSQGYKRYTPAVAQAGVGNFFSNLSDVKNALNGILQIDAQRTLTGTMRFMLNSTFGIFGLIDIATAGGLQKESTSLSMTLYKYGVPSGPYLVLPFFGPDDVRGSVALLPESYYLSPDGDGSVAFSSQWLKENKLPLTVVDVVNIRAQFLGAGSLIVGDKYTFMRDMYLQRRAHQQQGGVVTHDAFGDEQQLGDGVGEEEEEGENLDSF